MNFIKQFLKSKDKPYFDRFANEKYKELFQRNLIKNQEKIYGIIQEIHLNNQIVVSAIFRDNYYQNINESGKVKSAIITNKKHNIETKKIFIKCDDNIKEINNYKLKTDEYLKHNGIRLTFISEINTYQKYGSFEEFSKEKFITHILIHFSNLLRIFEKRRIDKILAQELKKNNK